MAFCSKCGKELEPNALFCSGCGTGVNGEANQYVDSFDPMTGFLNFQTGNTMASWGFLFAFLVPVLGIVFSSIGLTRAKEFNDQGKSISIAGIIIGSVLTLIYIILSIVFLVNSLK